MFYGKIRIEQGFSYILYCPLRILYNKKFVIMATFLGPNAVVVTRVHCIVLLEQTQRAVNMRICIFYIHCLFSCSVEIVEDG